MTLPYRLHPLAEDDLVAAWSWYEEQVQGLGDQFLDVVRLTIELAADWPNSGAPVVYDTTGEVTERKVATPGFPTRPATASSATLSSSWRCTTNAAIPMSEQTASSDIPRRCSPDLLVVLGRGGQAATPQ